MDNYNEILNKYSSDKGTRPNDQPNLGNGYGDLYERYFRDYKESALNICDIGIDQGRSLLANQEYFTNATIHGVDISDKSIYRTERIKTYMLDQGNEKELENFFISIRSNGIDFDIIIDDGSHDVSHQQMTFGKLFDLLKPGGIYIIEDMCTSFFKEGVNLYGYLQTNEKIDNNTVKFLTNRPLRSPWIEPEKLDRMDLEIDYIMVFDKLNRDIPYLDVFPCINDYPARSITSIIKKK
jgi:SAM-dependent methyltransferase